MWTYAPPELSEPAITRTLLTDMTSANQETKSDICSAQEIRLKRRMTEWGGRRIGGES
jgi:hypothetical protein